MVDTPSSAGAGATQLLTTAQNLVQAVNNALQNYLKVQGTNSRPGISGSAVLVKQGPGRLASVSVTTVGSAAGAIYDANAATSTSNPIYDIPMTAGVIFVNLPVSNGIVVAPGSGQVVTVSYS